MGRVLVMENKVVKVLGIIEFFAVIAMISMPGLMRTGFGVVVSIIAVIVGAILLVLSVRELIHRQRGR